MSDQTFKAGDRVQRGSGTESVIVGPDQRVGCSDRWIIWTQVDDDHPAFGQWTSWAADLLSLIPQTVTVTVELPREEAEEVGPTWEDDPDGYELAYLRGYARFTAAVREALQ